MEKKRNIAVSAIIALITVIIGVILFVLLRYDDDAKSERISIGSAVELLAALLICEVTIVFFELGIMKKSVSKPLLLISNLLCLPVVIFALAEWVAAYIGHGDGETPHGIPSVIIFAGYLMMRSLSTLIVTKKLG